jgi:hypothetical protein
MSEVKSRFRIKNDSIEIEYEGPVEDVRERYKEAFDWLKSMPREEMKKTEKKPQDALPEKKKGTRGPEIWSPAIDDLIKEGFFKRPNQRKKKDVVKELADKALPVEGKGQAIVIALRRKVRKGELKGTKGPDGWTFWTE